MPHYLVFAGRKWTNAFGKSGITWEPAGVFTAEDPETACLVAAQKQGVGTCFAMEGYPWGVDTVDAGQVHELGAEVDPITRLERMGANLAEKLAAALPAAKQPELEAGDNGGE